MPQSSRQTKRRSCLSQGGSFPALLAIPVLLGGKLFWDHCGIQDVWTSWEDGSKALQRFDVIDARHIPVVAVNRVRKHPPLFSAILCAIPSSDIAMNEQLTTADIVETVTDSTSECFTLLLKCNFTSVKSIVRANPTIVDKLYQIPDLNQENCCEIH